MQPLRRNSIRAHVRAPIRAGRRAGWSDRAAIAAIVAAIIGVSTLVSAQSTENAAFPYDWSHRHLIFSDPFTPGGAAGIDAAAARSISNDPRFEFQTRRRAAAATIAESAGALASDENRPTARTAKKDKPQPNGKSGHEIHRDWSNVMGGASGVGTPGTFPAKFAFGTASASCATDFVVYTTSSPGATGSGNFATRTGTFSNNNVTAGQTVTITNTNYTPSLVLVLTASTTTNTGPNFLKGATSTATAANLASAISRNGGTVGVTASSSGTGVTVAAITQAVADNTITLAEGMFGFSWGGNLTNGSGTAGQPTVFAVNQLYSSCGSATQAVPAAYWSYNTGTGAVARTSPILSTNGDQVAFVQNTAGVASLVLLKWSSSASIGTVGAPTAPTSVSAGSYRACTAPCMAVLAFSGNPADTYSSPYYDYANDIVYVGADNGTLHKFTNVFNGNPAEVVAAGSFPATVSSGNALSSPVYDSVSGLVFVGSARGATTGGQLHTVNASGTVLSSAQLATNNSKGLQDAVIVDSTAQRVYAFVGSDNSTNCNLTVTPGPCGAVYQFVTTSSISGLSGTRTQVGRGSLTANKPLYAGTFDNGYYTSAAASPTGFLYVCGAVDLASYQYTMWRIPITANVMGAGVIGPTMTSDQLTNASCSPVTEVFNGTNDLIFVSVPATGTATGCTSAGCIYMYNLTGITWNTSTAASAGLAAPGGTGGIIIDNTSATAGASQVYYSTVTSPGIAVQASQAALN